MRFIDYLDKGASLGADAPCLTMDGRDLSYGEVQRLSYRFARGLDRSGIVPGEKVAILSGNDPLAFACVFGISRAAAVWCPINPRNEAAENKFILDQFDCSLLLFHSSFAPMVRILAIKRLAHQTAILILGKMARLLTQSNTQATRRSDSFNKE